MIHDGIKFTIYDLISFEVKTIIKSKIHSEADWFNDYG